MRKGRRFFAALLVLLSCISIGMQAAATDAEELTKEEKKAKRMLERLYKLPVQSNELTNWPEGPGTYGEAAIVMEAENKKLLADAVLELYGNAEEREIMGKKARQTAEEQFDRPNSYKMIVDLMEELM